MTVRERTLLNQLNFYVDVGTDHWAVNLYSPKKYGDKDHACRVAVHVKRLDSIGHGAEI